MSRAPTNESNESLNAYTESESVIGLSVFLPFRVCMRKH